MLRAPSSPAEGLADAIPTSNQDVVRFAVVSLLILGLAPFAKEMLREWLFDRAEREAKRKERKEEREQERKERKEEREQEMEERKEKRAAAKEKWEAKMRERREIRASEMDVMVKELEKLDKELEKERLLIKRLEVQLQLSSR